MFDISELVVKKRAGEISYNRGLDLYLRNKVRRIEVENVEDSEHGLSMIHIDSIVQSSLGYDDYSVSIKFDDKVGIMDAECECQSGICKHIVATLLKYMREKDNIFKRSKSMKSFKIDSLTNQIKDGMMYSNSEAREINLEVKYEFEIYNGKASSIELKVGENKAYIVKNLKDFLKAYKYKHEDIEFGKGFTYKPHIHKFGEKANLIIGLLEEIYEVDEWVNQYDKFSTFQGKLISGKKAYLTDSQVIRFLDFMKDESFEAVIRGVEYSNARILQENLPLRFNMGLKNNDIIIEHLGSMPEPLLEDGKYFFSEGNIYMPEEQQMQLYAPFYKMLKDSKKNYIEFAREECEKVISYIIPTLKKISEDVSIDEKLEESFYEETLKTEVYFDKEEEKITAEIRFSYGSIYINPLKENIQRIYDKILIRDIGEELKVIAVLNTLGFEKGTDKYLLTDEEKLVDLLTEGIGRLQDISEIFYSDAFRTIKVYGASSLRSSIRLNENDLLEFSFNIEGIGKEELRGIFYALREKKRYYKLKSGGFISLESKEINDIGNLIEYLDIRGSEIGKEKIILPKYNAMYIEQSLRQNSMSYIERNRRFRELVNSIRDIQDMDFTMPDELNRIMRNYQKIGFKWFKTLSSCGFGGILADEMGLGKTLQAISFMLSETKELKDKGINGGPHIVIAPTSLVYNWKSEIEKFTSSLKTLVISGSRSEREELRKEIQEADIIITSYPLIRRDIDDYMDIKFNYCFLDEAQQIKNPMSMNAQSVKEIKANGYFALTGTPIENSLTELWSIFDFIMPGYLLTHGKFIKKYEVPIIKDKDSRALDELNRHIKPFILRRMKKDVIKELPPKIEHKLVIEMTEEQKKLYAAYLVSIKDEINDGIRSVGFNKSRMRILAGLTRLRQICCEPTVFLENYDGESGKMLALDDLLEESINGGHRILLFSQFTSVLKNIANRLNSNQISYLYLDGQTKAEERGILVKDFNEGKGSVFLISLKAGGTGLNLTGADTVIHFDPWWNPAVEEQASDRAHRIGQKKSVEVIKLITRGTIEEKIYDLQQKKKEMIKSIIDQDANEGDYLISQLNEQEIQELFK